MPNRKRVVLGGAGALLMVLLCASGCHKPPDAPPLKAPFESFTAGAWKSPKGIVWKAPAPSNHDWRVMALQDRPRQKKNPHWKAIPISESGTLEMPPGSHFQCIYNPVSFRSWPNEHANGVDRWEVIRSVRCSNDGWVTYTQATHVVTMSGDGTTVTPAIDQTELSFHETINGQVVDSAVLLRSD